MIAIEQLYRATATLLLCLALLHGAAAAHEIRPAISRLAFEGQHFTLSIETNLEAMLAGIGEGHADTADSPNAAEYDGLRQLPPDALRTKFDQRASAFSDRVIVRFDGAQAKGTIEDVAIPEIGDVSLPRYSTIVIGGAVPEGARTATVQWDGSLGPLIVDYTSGDAAIEFSTYLPFGEESEPIPIEGEFRRPWHSVFRDYTVVGFTHIVPKGLDHILFVVGLFLLSPRLKPLLWQVTSFTIAHSVTLALAISGVVTLPPAIVEPLIAASIVYVGVENALTDRMTRWRPAVVFLFGLLHGLGFAGVLSEIGLSQTWFLTGLLAFNLGVEFGQLSVVGGCLLVVGFWFSHRPWYRPMITIPASIAVAAVGAFWFFERVLA